MTSYRVYGPSYGVGSFVTITRGVVEGLLDLGCDAHFCPTDLHEDEERPYAGSQADVAIWLGLPIQCRNMLFLGSHERRFVMLAPNSTVSPTFIFDRVQVVGKAKIITPSNWGKEVLEAQEPGCVAHVVPHGVGKKFAEFRRGEAQTRERDKGLLRFLHVASTTAERKGTMELLTAWEKLMASSFAGSLTIMTDHSGMRHLSRQRIPSGVTLVSAHPRDDEMPAFMSGFDVVVQPSRAEGFGIVPLEAACLGLPVVMTTCTGHSQFAATIVHVPVAHGDLEPISDYEGSMAPSVSPAAIFDAIVEMRRHFQAHSLEAWNRRAMVYDLWSWGSSLQQFVENMEGL